MYAVARLDSAPPSISLFIQVCHTQRGPAASAMILLQPGAACCTLAPGGQGLAYALASAPGGDLRETCKALNAAYLGRGGGKPGFCQGSLASGSFEQVKDFLLNTL